MSDTAQPPATSLTIPPAIVPKKSILAVLGTAIEESPGVISSVRVQLMACLCICVVLPLLVWAFMCWHHRAILVPPVGSPPGTPGTPAPLPELPASVTSFCQIIFSASAAAKVLQYRSEPENPNLPPAPPAAQQ